MSFCAIANARMRRVGRRRRSVRSYGLSLFGLGLELKVNASYKFY